MMVEVVGCLFIASAAFKLPHFNTSPSPPHSQSGRAVKLHVLGQRLPLNTDFVCRIMMGIFYW